LSFGAAIAAGCGQPTAPSPILASDLFTGTIAVQGSDTKSFVVAYDKEFSDGSVTVTAISKAADATPLAITIGVGFGVTAADGSCVRDPTFSAAAAAIGQELVATGVFFAGTYCVQVFDAGTLTEPVTYALTVRHY
jgi:hypothetical protein